MCFRGLALRGEVPFILCSGTDSRFDADSAPAQGLAHFHRKPVSIVPETPAQQSPAGPMAPVSQGGGLLDTLKQVDQQQNQQAPAPAPGPQVPQSQ